MDQIALERASQRYPDLRERIFESVSTLLKRREQPAPYGRPGVEPTWDPDRQREAFDEAIQQLERAREHIEH